MEDVRRVDREIFDLIKQEEQRQSDKIRLIASENYASPRVMEAQGSRRPGRF